MYAHCRVHCVIAHSGGAIDDVNVTAGLAKPAGDTAASLARLSATVWAATHMGSMHEHTECQYQCIVHSEIVHTVAASQFLLACLCLQVAQRCGVTIPTGCWQGNCGVCEVCGHTIGR